MGVWTGLWIDLAVVAGGATLGAYDAVPLQCTVVDVFVGGYNTPADVRVRSGWLTAPVCRAVDSEQSSPSSS
ncbi:hypothetical protein U1Q18_046850 [Sarracenia purpurea var. burkii]